MKSKILLILIILVLALGIVYALAANEKMILNKQISIKYENKEYSFFDVNGNRIYPISYNGSTYLPIRALSALFDQKINWDGEKKAINLGKGEISKECAKVESSPKGQNEQIEAVVNKTLKVYYDGSFELFFDEQGRSVFPISYNGTTYLPVRALSDIFSMDISWDSLKNEITITKSNSNYRTGTTNYKRI